VTTHRVRRVESLLAREISDLLVKEIKDPRVSQVTVVEIEASGDLRRAVIYYRLLSNDIEHRKEAESGLKSAAGTLKRMIGERVRLKFMPELVFRYDPTEDKAERIEALLREVASEGDSRENE